MHDPTGAPNPHPCSGCPPYPANIPSPIVTYFPSLAGSTPQVTPVHGKKIFIATLAGGFLLTLCEMVFAQAANAIVPYNIFEIGGMRSPADPVMLLFFAYPFVLAFTSSLVFDTVEKALDGPPLRKGIGFGVILLLLVTLPSLFVIYSSMDYPTGFYIANFLTGVIGFPLLGCLFAWIWAKDR